MCLRDILSRYLGTVQPGELRFGACRNGKPKLRHPDRDVRFNVSHTGDAGVIAVALGREVGVDIERLDRRIRNVGKLMEARLTPHEQLFVRRKAGDRIDASHGDSLRGEFIKMWTRKEAFVKCTGEGIARGLKTFEIVDDVLVDIIDGMKASDGDWSVIDLNIGEDHVGTVVTEGSGLSVVKVEYRMDA